MATPHNSADRGDIAETILLPGDPLRAKLIAEKWFEEPVQFNSVRNMLGYTGFYEGKRISIMGTGMGMPSMGIYSHELIHFYGVRNLIRVGTCGAIREDSLIGDIFLAQGACTDSRYAHQFGLPGTYSAIASFELLRTAADTVKDLGLSCRIGNVVSSDAYYTESPEWKEWAKMGCLGIEMETYALYCNASRMGARSLSILTVSDSIARGESAGPEERLSAFTGMMRVALEVAAKL